MVATVLIIIVAVFIICHSLKFVINLLELYIVIKSCSIFLTISFDKCFVGKNPDDFWSPKMNIMVAFSHLLIVFNSSVNFIIYCCKVKPRNAPIPKFPTSFQDTKFRALLLNKILSTPPIGNILTYMNLCNINAYHG